MLDHLQHLDSTQLIKNYWCLFSALLLLTSLFLFKLLVVNVFLKLSTKKFPSNKFYNKKIILTKYLIFFYKMI